MSYATRKKEISRFYVRNSTGIFTTFNQPITERIEQAMTKQNQIRPWVAKMKKEGFLVAIDYDGTWKEAPQLWEAVSDAIKDNGGNCICITSRATDTKNKELEKSIGKHMKILYANGKPKEKIAKDNGYRVNVWIDDKPETIKANTPKKSKQLNNREESMNKLTTNRYLKRLSSLNKMEKEINSTIEQWKNYSPPTDEAAKNKWKKLDRLHEMLTEVSNARNDLERQREKEGIPEFY